MTDLTTARGVLAELVGAHEKLAQLVAATTVSTEANSEFAAVTKRLEPYATTPRVHSADPLHKEAAAEIVRLRDALKEASGVIERCGNIMRGGEGDSDQGEALDRALRLPDGGDVSTIVQLRCMAFDAVQWRKLSADWQIVPKVLTPKMRDALLSCESGEFSTQGGWEHILSAAPTP